MDAGILVPLSPFIMVVAIVFISRYFKSRDQKELQATFRAAIERGQQLSKEDFNVMRASLIKPPSNDIRTGLILLAVGTGVIIVGFSLGHTAGDWRHPLTGLGVIPILVGIVLLGFGIYRSKNENTK